MNITKGRSAKRNLKSKNLPLKPALWVKSSMHLENKRRISTFEGKEIIYLSNVEGVVEYSWSKANNNWIAISDNKLGIKSECWMKPISCVWGITKSKRANYKNVTLNTSSFKSDIKQIKERIALSLGEKDITDKITSYIELINNFKNVTFKEYKIILITRMGYVTEINSDLNYISIKSYDKSVEENNKFEIYSYSLINFHDIIDKISISDFIVLNIEASPALDTYYLIEPKIPTTEEKELIEEKIYNHYFDYAESNI